MSLTVKEIEQMWEQDAPIDQNNLGNEAARTPVLHAKYYSILLKELFVARAVNDEVKTLERDLFLYYGSFMSSAEIRSRGWDDFDYTILKSDVPKFIESNPEMQKLRIKQTIQTEKVHYIKSILDNIKDRGWNIKHIIDWKKFQAGA